MQPSFTPPAQLLWEAISPHFQERVLQNVWCPHCGDMTIMTDFTGEVHGRSLVLRGTCATCRGRVARVLEGAPESETLQPGDQGIWWKRIPGVTTCTLSQRLCSLSQRSGSPLQQKMTESA
jgi:hypothetical protein